MEVTNRSTQVTVEPGGTAGEARRAALLLGERLGLSETCLGNVAIAVTEAVTNLVKHAGGGQILVRALDMHGTKGLELLAIDSGPGMHDTSRCLADGFSTAGSPGTGLGAISRLSSFFELYSQPGKGTVLAAQFWPEKVDDKSRLIVGVVCVPVVEREPCGDSWSHNQSESTSKLLLVDGLGHGLLAARAADEAVRVFEVNGTAAPEECIRSMHGPLRATRGASLAIAELDLVGNILRWSGVGNISGTVWHEGSTRSMVSHNGTVGHELHQVTEFRYPFGKNALLVMHSDGVNSRWKLDQYPGLTLRHPSIVAAVLYRDFKRGRDDATVVVARER